MARVALLIGIRDYYSRLEPLPAAPRDVDAVKRVLKPPNLAYFQDIEELSTAPAGEGISTATLAETIEGWCLRREPEDVALLYISGHLVQTETGEVYLAASDTQWEGDRLLQSRALPLTQLHRWLCRSATAQQVVVLDCCVTTLAPAAESDPSLQLSRILAADQRLVMAAAQHPTYSAAHKQGKNSLYTHYWVEGLLTGAALARLSEWIFAADLYAYIQKRFQVAVPAIAPYLDDQGLSAATVKLAKAHFPLAEYRYRQQVEASIQQGKFSAVGREILNLTWRRLGLTAECAAVIEEQSLHPHRIYQANRSHYHDQIADIIQGEYPLSEQGDRHLEVTRQRLGLRPEDVEPIRRELTYPKYLHNLRTFRKALTATMTATMKDGQTLGDAVRSELAQLQQMLGLSDQEVAALKQEVFSQRSSYEQRCRQYRQALEVATAQGIAHSPLTREELDAYRQSLGLTHEDVNHIEQQAGQRSASSSDGDGQPGPNQPGRDQPGSDQQGPEQPSSNQPGPNQPNSDQPSPDCQRSDHQRSDSSQNGAGQPSPPLELQPNPPQASSPNGVTSNGTGQPPSQSTIPQQFPSDQEKQPMTDHFPGTTPSPGDADLETRKQQYAEAVREAAQEHLPIAHEDMERLRHLGTTLSLSSETTHAILESTIAEAKQAERDYETKRNLYEDAFRQAAGLGLPLSPEQRQSLNQRQQELGLKPQDVQMIEDWVEKQMNHNSAEVSPSAGMPTEGNAAAPDEPPPSPAIAFTGNGRGRSAPDGGAAPSPFLEDTVFYDGQSLAEDMPAPPLLLLNREEKLRSPQGVSYENLRSLLKDLHLHDSKQHDVDEAIRERWREADHETFIILVQLANQDRARWLDKDDLGKVPLIDWQILDQLWYEASDGQFGFRTQRAIFREVLDEQAGHNNAAHFGKRVGWMMLEKEVFGFKYYNQLTFSRKAPAGHLPAKWFWEIPWWKSVLCGGLGSGRGGCGDDNGMLFKLYDVHLRTFPPLTHLP